MVAIYAVTSTTTNQVARPAKARNFLGIYSQGAAINVAFDQPAVTSATTAGQFAIVSGGSLVFGPGDTQTVPAGAINVIGAGALTIVEG